MTDQIVFRTYQKSDHEPLSAMIRSLWHYDDFYSPSTAKLISKAYLDLCLIEQTYTQVAEINGKPIGIIMGFNTAEHKIPLKYRLQMVKSMLLLFMTREGRDAVRFLKEMDEIDRRLLAGCETDYQGEVSFFAVHPEYHGKGIGKELFHRLLQYMKEERISNFYLFTDTSCNYGFYERQNMRRRGAEKHSFQLEKKTLELTFFIYEYPS